MAKKCFQVRADEREIEAWKAAALLKGQTYCEWIRLILDEAAGYRGEAPDYRIVRSPKKKVLCERCQKVGRAVCMMCEAGWGFDNE